MTAGPAPWAAAILLAASTFAAPSAGTAPPLPAPELSAVEPAVREQLEAARRTAQRLLEDDHASASELAESIGSLGRLYLLYSLLDSAEACFVHALALAPGDFRWNYYLATIQQRVGRFDGAAERLEAALAARPRDLPSLIRLGQVELGRNRPESAASYFQRALEHDPACAAALYGLAQVAALGGDHSTAARLFQSVLEMQPGTATAHYQLGLALRQLGDLERARFHLERPGRSEVSFPDPLLSQLATLAKGAAIRMTQATRARGRGDLATAQAALESAVEADPENLTARLALASDLIRQDHIERAVGELEEVLRRDPGNAAAHYNLGTAMARVNRIDTAIEHLRRAAELAPDFANAQVNLAGMLRNQGRFGEAVDAFNRALELEPDNVVLEVQRAEALHHLGRVDEAAAALSRAAPRAAGDAASLLLLGQAFETRGDGVLAASAYRRASDLRDQPEAAEAARKMGLLSVREGRSEEALAYLDTAVELRPDWVEARADRATVNGQLGRFAAAADDFEEVIRRAPGNEGARIGRTVALLLDQSYPEAAAHLEASVVSLPDSLPLRHSLARLLAACPDPTIRDGARALALAQEVAARERNLEHGQTLAMALAELGRYGEAADLQRQILQFAERAGAAAALPSLRRRLEAYEQGEPVRAPWLDGRAGG